MDMSLNKEAKGQNRGFEESVALVKSELSKDGNTLDLTAAYLKEYGAKDIANMDFLEGLQTLELGTNMMGAKGVKSCSANAAKRAISPASTAPWMNPLW